ncbi:exosome non-catalytic core subunit RRP46 SCDLUD_002344 [Saccharomycodes ludwigii]|uniref:exosome non-catalytic core subunit RRP46 n=1 Tax=Saccharomycodes ludwigii TaxID=36035 RepID=UPI001E857615|nr:hypothetical protein SCDLUD_002344 [Saccharomycodes ludwigii]KAH3900885.1 hypothetical protein SCDLUD_002344 [Saccharomycodes ludwigii]
MTKLYDIQSSLLLNVDGSCEYNTPNIKVLAAVTGPIEPKARQEIPQQLALEIVVKPCVGIGPTPREVLIQDKIHAVLQHVLCKYLYPRKLLQLTFQIIQNSYFTPSDNNITHTINSNKNIGIDPSTFCELSTCLNSAFIALLDSGIGLQTSYASCCIGIVTDSAAKDKLIDLTTQFPESTLKSCHVIVLEINDAKQISNVLMIDSAGSFTEKDLLNVLTYAENRAIEKMAIFRSVISSKLQRDFIWRE